jgi:hypothetical protein
MAVHGFRVDAIYWDGVPRGSSSVFREGSLSRETRDAPRMQRGINALHTTE